MHFNAGIHLLQRHCPDITQAGRTGSHQNQRIRQGLPFAVCQIVLKHIGCRDIWKIAVIEQRGITHVRHNDLAQPISRNLKGTRAGTESHRCHDFQSIVVLRHKLVAFQKVVNAKHLQRQRWVKGFTESDHQGDTTHNAVRIWRLIHTAISQRGILKHFNVARKS